MAKLIRLTSGNVAIVDAEDYDWLSRWAWHRQTGPYAGRHRHKADGPGPSTILMHRVILGRHKDLVGLQVDHRNNYGLDNRKANLRAATRSLNGANRRPSRCATTSRYRGVNVRLGRRPRAHIYINHQQVYLGSFPTEEEAARAYDAAALEAFGEFARVNFP